MDRRVGALRGAAGASKALAPVAAATMMSRLIIVQYNGPIAAMGQCCISLAFARRRRQPEL